MLGGRKHRGASPEAASVGQTNPGGHRLGERRVQGWPYFGTETPLLFYSPLCMSLQAQYFVTPTQAMHLIVGPEIFTHGSEHT